MILIQGIMIAALAVMVFVLCYMCAVRDGRIEALERHDTALRSAIADHNADLQTLLQWKDDQIGGLLRENTELLIEAAHHKRGSQWQHLEAEELIEDLAEWLGEGGAE